MQRDMLNGPEQSDEFGDYSVESEYGNLIRASKDGKVELRSKNANEGSTIILYDNLGQLKKAKPFRNTDIAFEKFKELTGSNETIEQFYGQSDFVDDEDQPYEMDESKKKLTEIDVNGGQQVKLKLPVPQSQVQPEMSQEAPDMGVSQPPMGEPQQNENPFGNEKFDAGVEADEATDPKLFIQQLSGKLAQSLRAYNETTKDGDLNKFATNSIISASIPNMSPEDAQDVIKKVQDNIGKVDGGDVTDSASIGQTSDVPPEQGMPSEAPIEGGDDLQQAPPKMESKGINNKNKKKLVKESETIDELIDRMLRGDDSEMSNRKPSGKKNIFKAPEFK